MKTRRTNLLSRSREVELARSIEAARLELTEAVTGSPEALRALGKLLDEAKQGPDEAARLFLGFSDEWEETERALDELITLLGRLQSQEGGTLAENQPRAELAQALLRGRLSRQGVDGLLCELESGSSTRRARRRLARTISTLTRCRETYESAKAALVRANMGLVFSMAQRRIHAGLSVDDVVQEGTMGLMRAVDRFDHQRGIKFGTYAGWWIRHAINRALSDYARTIRVPVHVLDSRFKVQRATQQLVQKHGREPTHAELATQTGLSPERIGMVAAIPNEPMSLDAPMWEDGEGRLSDLIPDSAVRSPLDALSAKQAEVRLRHLLKTLSPREEEVIRLRFGIDCPEALRLEEIGRKFALSRERIRQIEAEALRKLHQRADAQKLDSLMVS